MVAVNRRERLDDVGIDLGDEHDIIESIAWELAIKEDVIRSLNPPPKKQNNKCQRCGDPCVRTFCLSCGTDSRRESWARYERKRK